MKQVLLALLTLPDEGVLARFAIGGAVAASYYVEAVATEDLDVFAFLAPPAPETGATLQAVAAATAAWRRHAAALTREEKIAAIERMRERDAAIRQVREAAGAPVRRGQS